MIATRTRPDSDTNATTHAARHRRTWCPKCVELGAHILTVSAWRVHGGGGILAKGAIAVAPRATNVNG